VWFRVIPASDVPGRAIVPVDVAGDDAVVWRAADGRAHAVARWCPHLDWDLAEAVWRGDELLCAGHGWSILGDGRACKRNEHGRVDDKGATRTWRLREHYGWIEAELEAPAPGASQ
jgi:phenylpropionate dioxygenase-like ring-hydroxylating dioxygenase large terminal subunit